MKILLILSIFYSALGHSNCLKSLSALANTSDVVVDGGNKYLTLELKGENKAELITSYNNGHLKISYMKTFGQKQSGLQKVLFQKLFEIYPNVNSVEAEYSETNYMVFMQSMIEVISGEKLSDEVKNYSERELGLYFQDNFYLAFILLPKDIKKRMVSSALNKTPLVKILKHYSDWGLYYYQFDVISLSTPGEFEIEFLLRKSKTLIKQ